MLQLETSCHSLNWARHGYCKKHLAELRSLRAAIAMPSISLRRATKKLWLLQDRQPDAAKTYSAFMPDSWAWSTIFGSTFAWLLVETTLGTRLPRKCRLPERDIKHIWSDNRIVTVWWKHVWCPQQSSWRPCPVFEQSKWQLSVGW